MENVKKAQQLVQVEAAKAQEELAAYVSPPMDATAQVDIMDLIVPVSTVTQYSIVMVER